MNTTIEKFGWPATLVREYAYWVVLLRPQAPTLCSLILAAKSEATAYAELPAAAFAEQARVVHDIESALGAAVRYEKINYLMLMMADPHVHIHVIPRYGGGRVRNGTTFTDAGWPKLPDLGNAITLTDEQIGDQLAWLRELWPLSY